MPTTESSSEAPSTALDRVEESIQSTVDVAFGDLAIQSMRGRSGAVTGSQGGSASDPFALAPAIAMAEQLAASDQRSRDYADRARAGVNVAQARFDANSALEQRNNIEAVQDVAKKAVVAGIDFVASPLTAGQVNLGTAVDAGTKLYQCRQQVAILTEVKNMENSDPKLNDVADYIVGKKESNVAKSFVSINPIAGKVHTAVGVFQRVKDAYEGRDRSETELQVGILHAGIVANHPQALVIATALFGNSPSTITLIQNIKTAQSTAGIDALKGAVRK